MTLRRALGLTFAFTFTAMWSVCVYTYSVLPARFAAHFDASGVPDRFVDKSLGAWLALPILFTVLTALFALMAVAIPKVAVKYPRFLNVPEKSLFLRLTDEARATALAPMQDLALMMGPALHLLAAYIQWGSATMALQPGARLSATPVAFVLLYAFGTLFVAIVRTRDAVKALAS